MSEERKHFDILVADDDDDDFILLQKAFKECGLVAGFYRFSDGEEILEHLDEIEKQSQEIPKLILLDLNMPKKDGKETLKEIRNRPYFVKVPVIILTTSQSIDDINDSYEFGANSFIRKPVTFDGLLDVIKTVKHYWFEVVSLPKKS